MEGRLGGFEGDDRTFLPRQESRKKRLGKEEGFTDLRW